MVFKHKLAAALALVAVAGCKDGTGSQPTEACAASNPREEYASIDNMPGPNDNPTLHVAFKVDSPYQGDEYALAHTGSEEISPPNYIFDLNRVTAGMAPAISEVAVNLDWPEFPESELGVVKINCGGKLFLEIPVEETS